jgi:hypothetical protein
MATPVQDDEQFIDQIVGRRALNLAGRTRRSPAGPERTTGPVGHRRRGEDQGLDPLRRHP